MSADEQPITIEEVSQNVVNPTPEPLPTPPISIDDLMNTVEMIQRKEAEDKVTLESIGAMSHEELKTKLIAWAKAGFPNAYEITRVSIVPPAVCSDGVTRNLTDYIQYCSGKQFHEHIVVLAAKATGMTISFTNRGNFNIAVVVTKA